MTTHWHIIYNALYVFFVLFLSAGDSLISFDDDQATPSQAPSVNAMASQMQAMSKQYTRCPIDRNGHCILNGML